MFLHLSKMICGRQGRRGEERGTNTLYFSFVADFKKESIAALPNCVHFLSPLKKTAKKAKAKLSVHASENGWIS